jgi:photosystem II stability/assembly factor-like uncharacterized protein
MRLGNVLQKPLLLTVCGLIVAGAAGLAAFAASRQDGGGCISGLEYREPPDGNRIESLVVSNSVPGRVYATTSRGRLYEGSGDRTFQWRLAPSRSPGRLAAAVGSTDVLYAEWNALFRSKDRGRSWQRLTCGLLVSDVAVSNYHPSTIFLAAAIEEISGSQGGGLYRTLDSGRSWRRFTRFARMHPDSDQHSVDLVAVSPADWRQVYAAREFGGLDVSNDAGNHWSFDPVTRVEAGRDGPTVTAFGFGARGVMWLSSRGDGVFVRRARAKRWAYVGFRTWRVEQILPSRRVPGLAYVIAGQDCPADLTYGECQKLDSGGPALRTVDGGKHWRRMRALPESVFALTLQPADDTVYAWGWREVFRSRDHGAAWERLPKPG